MSDSEFETKPETKLSVQFRDPAVQPHYDPVPIPKQFHTVVEVRKEVGEGRKEDEEASHVVEDDNVYARNDSDEENNKVNEDEEEDKDKKDSKKPLLAEESVTIEINKQGYEGEDTPTLPLPDKKKKSKIDSEVTDGIQTGKLPVYLFPCTRIKDAWRDSTNMCSFLTTAVCIIFQTVGWFTCVGGVPFLSLVMLIIGSIYVDDCNIEPNIPVYLIVSGVIGTIQHVLTIWTKYVPKESHGRLKVYRSYCRSINGVFHLFMMIWFIVGCVWVYSAFSKVDYVYKEKEEYCHKTLYQFAFWILNLSFILLGMVVFLSICFIVCFVASPKDEEKGDI